MYYVPTFAGVLAKKLSDVLLCMGGAVIIMMARNVHQKIKSVSISVFVVELFHYFTLEVIVQSSTF